MIQTTNLKCFTATCRLVPVHCMKCGRCSCDLSVWSTLSSHTLLLGHWGWQTMTLYCLLLGQFGKYQRPFSLGWFWGISLTMSYHCWTTPTLYIIHIELLSSIDQVNWDFVGAMECCSRSTIIIPRWRTEVAPGNPSSWSVNNPGSSVQNISAPCD